VCYALLVAPWPLHTICTMTERAWTYTTDLPKWDSTLPEAASERDQHSPHYLDHLLYCSNSLCTIVSRIRLFPRTRLLDPFYDVCAASDLPYTHHQQMRPVLSLCPHCWPYCHRFLQQQVDIQDHLLMDEETGGHW
jgi:hypothetical protein